MPKFAANLTMLFTEYPFAERCDRAAAAGFSAVEVLFPYSEDVPALAEALKRHGQELVLFNLPVGDFAAGDRGMANDPAREREFRDGVARAIEVAAATGCTKVNCLVGLALPDIRVDTQLGTVAERLSWAAEELADAGVSLVVEPLNPYDAPGFLLPNTTEAIAMIDEVGHSNLGLQYDVYHAQRVEGNLTATIGRLIGRIGHVQVADSPDRHEPGTGEINYPYVFEALDAAGYDGWVSLEYRPLHQTEHSLGWLKDWGYWT